MPFNLPRRSATNQLRRTFAPNRSHVRRLEEGKCAAPACEERAKWLLLWKTPTVVITANRTEYEHSAELCATHATPRLSEARAALRLSALPKAAP